MPEPLLPVPPYMKRLDEAYPTVDESLRVYEEMPREDHRDHRPLGGWVLIAGAAMEELVVKYDDRTCCRA